MNIPKPYLSVILLILFSIIISYACFSQRQIILKRSLVIKCTNPEYAINHCNYSLLVPANRPGKQEVIDYKYSIQPSYVTKNKNNEYYIQWKKISFAQLKTTNLSVTMRINLNVYDLSTAKKQPVKNNQDLDTTTCLKDEENFRSKAKNIKDAALTLTGNTREEIVKAIFNYVINNLDYKIFFFQDRGAKQALKEGKGDCTEYSELMVTLCRAKNIPARIVEGIIPKSDGTVGYHNWVEVYFPQYGWVAFDPTWADNLKATTTFDKMKNAYIQLSNQRFVRQLAINCESDAIPYQSILKDSCTDLLNNISNKRKDALMYYNNFKLDKAEELLDTLLLYEPDNYNFWSLKGVVNARKGKFTIADSCLKKAYENTETSYERSVVMYAYGNYFALYKDGENAVKSLREAIDFGFTNYEHLLKDVDFLNIKNYQPFIDLENELKMQQNHKDK